jgi:hypothetical protein
MPPYTANLAPPESDSPQSDQDKVGTFINPILALAASDKYAIANIAKNASVIYSTALALGISAPKLNTFYNIKFQDKTSSINKWLVAYKGNFGQPGKPRVNITWKSMIRLIHTPNCISIAQINAGLPFAMPQRVAVDIPAAYYITAIAIIGTINEYPELLDTNYVHLTLADYYLAGQLPYNWFNIFELLNIFYRRYTLYRRANLYCRLTLAG